MRYGDIQIPSTTNPPSENNGVYYYDTDLNKFQFRENDAWVGIGGGSQTPWTSDINGSAYSLLRTDTIEVSTLAGYENLVVTGYYSGTYAYGGEFSGKHYWGPMGGWYIHWDNVHNLWVQEDGLTNNVNLTLYAANATLTGTWTLGIGGVAVEYAWSIDNIEASLPAIYVNFAYRLPTVDGTDGYVLTCHNDGTTTWDIVNALPSGTIGQLLQYKTDGTSEAWLATSYIYDSTATPTISINPGIRALYAPDGTTPQMDWGFPSGVHFPQGINDGVSGQASISTVSRVLYDWAASSNHNSVDWQNRILYGDNGTTQCLHWGLLTGSSERGIATQGYILDFALVRKSIDPNNRILYDVDGTTKSLEWTSGWGAGYIQTIGIGCDPSLATTVGVIDVENSILSIYDGTTKMIVDWLGQRLFASDGTTAQLNWSTANYVSPGTDGTTWLGYNTNPNERRWRGAYFKSSFGVAEPNTIDILGETSAYAMNFDNDNHNMYMFDTNQGGLAIGWMNKDTSDSFTLGDTPTQQAMGRFSKFNSSTVFIAVNGMAGEYGVKSSVTGANATAGYFTDGARTVTICENNTLYGMTVTDSDYTIRMADNANNYAAIFQDTGGAHSVVLADGSLAAHFYDTIFHARFISSGTYAAYFDNSLSQAYLSDVTTSSAGHFAQSAYVGNIGVNDKAAHFEDGIRIVNLCDGSKAIDVQDGTYAFQAVDGMTTRAGYFSDGTRTVTMCKGPTYNGALEVLGEADFINSGHTGELYCGGGTYPLHAIKGSASAAGYFTDGTNSVYLGYGTDAISATNTSNVSASLASGTVAASFQDGTHTVQMANGSYAVEATSGNIKGAFTSSDGSAGVSSTGAIPVYNDGTTSGQLTSITIKDGIITAFTTIP